MKQKVITARKETALKLIKTEFTNEYLRSDDVCKIFAISNSTLKYLRGNGTIPAYKLGKTFVYKREEIEAALIRVTEDNNN